MLDRLYLEDMMEKVILRMIDPARVDIVEDFPISNLDYTKWEWPQGVGNYGMLKLFLATGETRWLVLLEDWFSKRIAEGLPPKNVNTMAPLLTLIHLHEITGRKDWLALCLEWAEWVMREMPRTPDGGLQHITIASANEGELWVDTLFMTVLFLAKVGKLTGRQDYVEETVHQFLVHVKYLVDTTTGLFFHGWTFKGRHNFARAHWGRGNCWFTAGVLDFIEIVGLEGGVKAFLLDTFRDQVEALLPLQDEGGMWHTLVDDPASYVESSATAGFGYGILKGVRLGFLPPSCRENGLRACEAVLSRVDETGSVTQVSYGTPMGQNLDFYRNIAVCPTAYGQSLTVLMLGEAQRALEGRCR
jgi:unsaturated rhamnogalacturonyl hydrolase